MERLRADEVFAADLWELGPAEVDSSGGPQQQLDAEEEAGVSVDFAYEMVQLMAFHDRLGGVCAVRRV